MGSGLAGRRLSRSNHGPVALCTLCVGLLNPPSLNGRSVNRVPASLAGVKAGCVHLCRVAGKMSLCEPIWQLTLRSCVMEFSINGLQLPLPHHHHHHPLPLPFTYLLSDWVCKERLLSGKYQHGYWRTRTLLWGHESHHCRRTTACDRRPRKSEKGSFTCVLLFS